MKQRPSFLALGVLGFCAWQSRDLLAAWRHAPFDRFDPLAFAIWLSPLALAWVRGQITGGANSTWLLVAAAASLLGALADLNVLPQIALAAALASFVPGKAAVTPWLLAAVTWMPLFGWLASGWGLPAVIGTRLAVAAAAAIWAGRSLDATAGICRP